MREKRDLALFDFDGTITAKDTFIPFLSFAFGWAKTLFLLVYLSPVAIFCLLGFCSRKKFKEAFFKRTIRGWSREKFESTANDFYKQKVKKLLKESALDQIKTHLSRGDDVSLVSASPQDWLKPFTDDQKINLIATKLEIKEGIYTGKISGKNCRKAEKVSRVMEIYNLKDYNEIYAYGDSDGDAEMLAIADRPFYRRFN